jgi:hypothetical protein
MDIHTGRVVTRRGIKEIRVTDLVIQAVENMAAQQEIHTLKITGRHFTPVYLGDWFTGVEYDHQNQNQDNDENYN